MWRRPLITALHRAINTAPASPQVRATNTTPAPQGANSYVELGGQYERYVQAFLADTLGIRTIHTGCKGDGGVDLRGVWPLPPVTRDTGTTHNVVVQCKNITSKCAPSTVREFEGVLARLPGNLGILACTQPASDLARHRVYVSTLPILYVMVSGEQPVVGEAVLSEAFRAAVPQLCVSAAISMDYQSGKRVDRLLFTFNGRPFTG